MTPEEQAAETLRAPPCGEAEELRAEHRRAIWDELADELRGEREAEWRASW